MSNLTNIFKTLKQQIDKAEQINTVLSSIKPSFNSYKEKCDKAVEDFISKKSKDETWPDFLLRSAFKESDEESSFEDIIKVVDDITFVDMDEEYAFFKIKVKKEHILNHINIDLKAKDESN